MSKGVSLEWSIFGIDNPLMETTPTIEQQLSDRYLLWTPRATVKVRRAIVKHKVLLNTTDDIDTFNVEQFNNDPSADPLRSFLALHALGERYAADMLILAKTRRIYHLDEGVRVYYTNFTFGEHKDTNFTITGRTPESILETKARLGITGNNLNFGQYLTTHVGNP